MKEKIEKNRERLNEIIQHLKALEDPDCEYPSASLAGVTSAVRNMSGLRGDLKRTSENIVPWRQLEVLGAILELRKDNKEASDALARKFQELHLPEYLKKRFCFLDQREEHSYTYFDEMQVSKGVEILRNLTESSEITTAIRIFKEYSLFIRKYGSFENQVGNLVDEVFATTHNPDAKEAAAEAINKVLGANTVTAELVNNIKVIKKNLVKFITEKYAENDDKLGAFLQDVQSETNGLPADNPLKLYNSPKYRNLFFDPVRDTTIITGADISSKYLEKLGFEAESKYRFTYSHRLDDAGGVTSVLIEIAHNVQETPPLKLFELQGENRPEISPENPVAIVNALQRPVYDIVSAENISDFISKRISAKQFENQVSKLVDDIGASSLTDEQRQQALTAINGVLDSDLKSSDKKFKSKLDQAINRKYPNGTLPDVLDRFKAFLTNIRASLPDDHPLNQDIPAIPLKAKDIINFVNESLLTRQSDSLDNQVIRLADAIFGRSSNPEQREQALAVVARAVGVQNQTDLTVEDIESEFKSKLNHDINKRYQKESDGFDAFLREVQGHLSHDHPFYTRTAQPRTTENIVDFINEELSAGQMKEAFDAINTVLGQAVPGKEKFQYIENTLKSKLDQAINKRYPKESDKFNAFLREVQGHLSHDHPLYTDTIEPTTKGIVGFIKEHLSASQWKEAFAAINKALELKNLQDIENIFKLKLKQAINRKYPDAVDKFDAFLVDMQHPESGLPDDHPLKNYKSQKNSVTSRVNEQQKSIPEPPFPEFEINTNSPISLEALDTIIKGNKSVLIDEIICALNAVYECRPDTALWEKKGRYIQIGIAARLAENLPESLTKEYERFFTNLRRVGTAVAHATDNEITIANRDYILDNSVLMDTELSTDVDEFKRFMECLKNSPTHVLSEEPPLHAISKIGDTFFKYNRPKEKAKYIDSTKQAVLDGTPSSHVSNAEDVTQSKEEMIIMSFERRISLMNDIVTEVASIIIDYAEKKNSTIESSEGAKKSNAVHAVRAVPEYIRKEAVTKAVTLLNHMIIEYGGIARTMPNDRGIFADTIQTLRSKDKDIFLECMRNVPQFKDLLIAARRDRGASAHPVRTASVDIIWESIERMVIYDAPALERCIELGKAKGVETRTNGRTAVKTDAQLGY